MESIEEIAQQFREACEILRNTDSLDILTPGVQQEWDKAMQQATACYALLRDRMLFYRKMLEHARLREHYMKYVFTDDTKENVERMRTIFPDAF